MGYLTKEEHQVLYFIFIGRNSLERLLETFNDEEKLLKIINLLESNELIKISWREGRIYGLIETAKGYQLIKNSGFEDWNISNN